METEEKIIEAAQTVFIKKGMDGARMQEIADEAKINKALLHYYFRTKEKLFNAIFIRIFNIAFPKLTNVLYSDIPIKEKIDSAVDIYLDLLKKHPYLPFFILREINREGTFIFKLVDSIGFDIQPVLNYIEEAMARGEIIQMSSHHLILNVVSLCVFPYAARPALQHVLYKGDIHSFEAFMAKRGEILKTFIWDAIKPKEILED